MSITERAAAESGDFPRLLKSWRQKRRLSQLDLALSAGVSQRHVSFLELGRANPSRGMILQLSDTLDVPLRERNAWLTAAGFAPLFRARPLDDPQMQQVLAAVQLMITSHAPFPAVAIDRGWTIRLSNAPFDRMSALLGDDLWRRVGGEGRNLMRLFFHPDGVRPLIANWLLVAPLLWRRAQREAQALGGQEIRALLDELAPLQDESLWTSGEAAVTPVMPFDIVTPAVRLSLFAIVAAFDTAQDVTADELRIELMFPADAATEALFRATV